MKEFWEKRYQYNAYAYGEEPNLFFKEQLDQLQPGKLLLPFEGEGRNAVYAASKGWEVIAFDFSEAGKKKALQLANKHGVNIDYCVSSWEAFDFQAKTYNVIALIYAHLPEEKRRLLHAKAAESLKEGGTLLLEAFTKKQLGNSSGGPQQLEALFDTDGLKKDFSDMRILSLKEETIQLNEGEFHNGKAEVIRLVAKK
jgi:cyclopropane fatty-acyl-phospholipid synthase-like methyltransferase